MNSVQQNVSFYAAKFASLLLLVLVSACSTVTEGSSQKIAVHSVPEGAACVLKANNEVIAEVASTPEVVTVAKSKYDIVVECTKDGYQKGKGKDHSDFAVSSLGNMVFGQFGMIGSMMDSATGAGNKYDSQVFVELEKTSQDMMVAQAAAVPAVQPAAQVQAVQVPVAQLSVAQPIAHISPAPLTPQMPPMQTAMQNTSEFPADFAVPDSMHPPFD